MKKVELMFLIGDTVKYTNKEGREITGEVYSISIDESGPMYLAYSHEEDMFFRFDSLDNVEEVLDYYAEACFEIEGSELL